MTDFALELATSLRRSATDRKDGVRPRPSTLQLFLEDDIATDSGPWSAQGHEPFVAILAKIDDVVRRPQPDTQIALLKAEQIGATTSIGLGPALHLAADMARNVGYFLPTDILARRIGRTRVKRTIAKSEYLAARMKDNSEAVNQATIKEFDGHFFYLVGLESMIGAISTPLDALLYDEVDLLPAENMEWSQGRVAHSDLRVSIYFSAGYTPGAGIDLRFQEGTQHLWRVDCLARGCKERRICLEENFPECMAEVRGKWVRACPRCHAPLDIVKGRWVACYPQRAQDRKFSYRLSALAIGAIGGDGIMSRWQKCRTKSQKAKFRCSVLALPDAGAMQPISDVELNRMQSGERHLSLAPGALPRYGGIDAGDMYYFAAYERRPDGAPHLVYVEEIDSDDAVTRISELIGKLGVVQLVADKKPHTNTVRALAYRFARIVVLQDFASGSVLKVVEEEHQQKKYRCVKVDREDSLDEMTSEFTSEHFLRIPEVGTEGAAPVMSVFASHLKQLRKDRSIDAKGRVVDVYKKGVANHFGMALNSARLAEQIAPSVMPFSFTPAAEKSSSHRGRSSNFWRAAING